MKKIVKNFIIITLIIVSIYGFYYVNHKNYIKHIEIQRSYIEHPENLPKKDFAVKTSFGFKNLKADLYRLKTIQYIGSNPVGSEYKKYLFVVLDIITELNPYFEHPYNIGQLLLPTYNGRYEDLSDEEQEKNIEEGIKLGLKGINYFCDLDKVEAIKKEENLNKILTEEKYKNPCKTHSIPYYLAYIYFYYKNDPLTAAEYYKVSSAVEGAPSGLKVMAAIMSSKGGNRKKSFVFFLNLAGHVEPDNNTCSEFSTSLEQLGFNIFVKNMEIKPELLKELDKSRLEYIGKFTKENEKDILSDTKCTMFLNKAIREINLEYLDRANKTYKLKTNKNSKNAKELFDEGFIEYLPVDFQQYEDNGIIYVFNKDTEVYDFDLGSYDDKTNEIIINEK